MKRLRPILPAFVAFLAACGGSTGPETPTVATVMVSPSTMTVTGAGSTAQFQATARDESGTVVSGQSVTWSSSDAGVATVSASGLATAVGAGTAAITATISGVAGSAVLTVQAGGQPCASPQTVTLAPGGVASFASTDCLVLPSGSNGDRYRVGIIRFANDPDIRGGSAEETAAKKNVATATLRVTGLGVAQAAPPAPLTRTRALSPVFGPELDPLLERALRRDEATRRFHTQLRNEEAGMIRRLGPDNVLRTRPRSNLAGLARATSPDKMTFDVSTSSSCSTSPEQKKTGILIYENDDVAFYQDSVQRAATPVTREYASMMANHYSNYAADMVTAYFGAPSDIDGNGKLIIFASPVVNGQVVAYVWSGDFFPLDLCAASNEAEIIYFNTDIILGLQDGDYQALSAVAHEAKHVVSQYQGINGRRGFHASWIEEGTAEISSELSSRIAWSLAGGPAVGSQVTRQDFVDTPGGFTDRNYGVVLSMARTVWYLSSQPNGVIAAPEGADVNSNIYGSGWLFHRWLGDAYGSAAVQPMGDAAFFRAQNDSASVSGTAGIQALTGKSFNELLEEFAEAIMLNGTAAPAPERGFTTYSLPSAAEIFCPPNPLGVFPWPVTVTGTPANCQAEPRTQESFETSASFASAEYSGPIGESGLRFHDFVSDGSGTGAQIELTMDGAGKLVVVRIN